MAQLSEKAKRDIANKFELPERRSKIASLIKQNEQLYCICRSTDSTRLMIECDGCDEWYHADCVNLTKAEIAAIKCYYCPLCTSANPKHKTTKKSQRTKAEKAKAAADAKKKRSAPPPLPAKSRPVKKVLGEKKAFRCTCEGQHRSRSCGKCSGCIRRGKCVDPKCFGKQTSTLSEEDYNTESASDSEDSEREAERVYVPPVPKGRAVSSAAQKSKNSKKKPVKKPAARGGAAKRNYRRKPVIEVKKPEKESSSDEETVEFEKGPRQCYGPGCTQLARQNSKYCRDFCGYALAHARIYAILPHRLREWISPSAAHEHNEVELLEIRDNYEKAADEIRDLLKQRMELEKHLARVKEIELNSDSSDEDHEEEGMMYCVSCGHEIAMKTCLKHMEKCFNKYEGKTTFGSVVQQMQIEGPPLFCDYYNAQSQTYCKRLAVLCAEHVKQQKIGEKELCGYPLGGLDDLAEKLNFFGKFCRVRKKKCNSHFSWEKLRKASIDMHRVRMYLRMDELLEKDHRIRSAQENRGSFMNILLNCTCDEELFQQMKAAQEKAKEETMKVAEEKMATDKNEEKVMEVKPKKVPPEAPKIKLWSGDLKLSESEESAEEKEEESSSSDDQDSASSSASS